MSTKLRDMQPVNGFTLIELVAVILLLSILAATIIPRILSASTDAKTASLKRVAASISIMVEQVQYAARIQGLRPVATNPSGPGGSSQSAFVINTRLGQFEVDWRNLCPESRAELGDQLTTLDFLKLESIGTGSFETLVTNQSTWIGYDIPPGQCYVVYDSFACTITVVANGC